jgi:tetratricopeptide (TPR) repeat protein
MGAVLGHKGDHAGQARVFRELLEASRRSFGDEHPRVASALDNLGMALLAVGETEEAEALLLRSVGMTRRLHRGDHRSTARALNDLAQALRQGGKLDEATPLYVEAAAIQERVLGPAHTDRAVTRPRDLGRFSPGS